MKAERSPRSTRIRGMSRAQIREGLSKVRGALIEMN